MLLDFGTPKKVRPTEEHNETYSSDSGVAGTYVPNMSEEDKLKWKAKHVKSGDDPRIEIRKTVRGSDPILASRYGHGGHCTAQVLIVVREDTVNISANGRMIWDRREWENLHLAVKEAQDLLRIPKNT